TLITEANPDDTVLVDDLGGWLTATLEVARVRAAVDDRRGDDLDGGSPAGAPGLLAQTPGRSLATAVRDCPADRLVLVSPEGGLWGVPRRGRGRGVRRGYG